MHHYLNMYIAVNGIFSIRTNLYQIFRIATINESANVFPAPDTLLKDTHAKYIL